MVRLIHRYRVFETFILIFCLTCAKDENTKLGQENAVWSESIYLRGVKPSTGEKLTDEAIADYANTLKKNKVKYAYLFAGPYEKDGHLPAYSFSDTARSTVSRLKKLYPQIVILPWVGGIQNKTVFLEDSLWVRNAIADTKKLIDTLKCEGIHVDLEFILKEDRHLSEELIPEKPGDRENYGKNVNSFHEKLRKVIPDKFISSVVTATSKDTRPWKRKTSMDELAILVGLVDQINFLYYDTNIHTQQLFESSCTELIRDIKSMKSKNSKTQYLVSIGTFVNDPFLQHYRDLKIESIPNTLKTIRKSINQVDKDQQLVDGISIFCDWETDSDEWKEFRQNWVNN